MDLLRSMVYKKSMHLFCLLLCLLSSPTWATQIGLKTGEVIDAKRIELPDQITIINHDGKSQQINLQDIQSIELERAQSIGPLLDKKTKLTEQQIKDALSEFNQPKPFETPKQTFLTWKEFAVSGSIDGMASCYASYKEKDVRKRLKKIKRKKRKEMQETMNLTTFSVADAVYQGNQAFLEVTWSKGLHSENQILTFIREDQDWKIIQ